MIPGLYAAANGMLAVEERQSAIANNIANVTTAGFKRHEPVVMGFQEVFLQRAGNPRVLDVRRAPGGGVKVRHTFSDFRNGVLRKTGNPLDIALVGPGFMAVETPQGERYTRDGSLTIMGDGVLATATGHEVQDVLGGAINVQGGSASIDGQGIVRVNDEVRGQIRLVEFAEPQSLEREGTSLFRANETALAGLIDSEATSVVPESLEGANVQLPREIAGMMLAARAYAANQRVIVAMDETLGRVIDRVGAPS